MPAPDSMTPGGTISVASLARARRIKRRYGAIISIHDPGVRGILSFHREPVPPLLRLWFVDLDEPHPGYRTATRADVESAVAFARENIDATMLVHCKAGISRSSAITLAVMADRLGRGREPEAMAALLQIRPEAVPNRIVVQHADALLGSNGRLLHEVESWDASNPSNLRRRELNAAIVRNDLDTIRKHVLGFR
ncbi:MAG: dual specificity protein phosphatase family protein [Alphaproteobacteria bacterium]|nr:dual specificity protein phosphatase family protein [Alphaproteobacteria bacterium]